MSANTSQSQHDARLMTAAMEWLRAVLIPPVIHQVSGVADVGSEQPVAAVASGRSVLRRRNRAHVESPVDRAEASTPPAVTEQGQVARRARLELDTAMSADPLPRFVTFCDAFGLYPFERDVLLLCFAHAVSTQIARLCRAMPESVNGCATFALALGLASDPVWDALPPEGQEDTTRLAAVPEWDALGSDRPLRRWRLLEIIQPGGQPLVSCPLRADERIVDHLMGRDYLDERIASLCHPIAIDSPRDDLSASQLARVDEMLGRLRSSPPQGGGLVVQMPGADTATKRLYAARIADELAVPVHTVAFDEVVQVSDPAMFARLWNRERRLQPLSLLIEAGNGAGDPAASLHRLLADVGGLVFVDSSEPITGHEAALILDTSRPTPREQWTIWNAMLGAESDQWADRLAGQFDLNLGEFEDAQAILSADTGLHTRAGARIWDFYRRRARPRLDGLAQLIAPQARLADVQLPTDEKRMLVQICHQTRNRMTVYDRYGFRRRLVRGLGITALFVGESGTGKTMAAEAIAAELELDLYRIDLSSVVSKYIGETEKNLRRVFDAAEHGGAVLLFDEADAIFGKRSEVRDSHDRYANIEVSYLLQRMEAYSGLAILTTNMKNALDQAFLRRLRFVVTFPFPGADERAKIWHGIFPVRAGDGDVMGVDGVDELDVTKLARPSLTGGQIRNIALNGAFLAAAGDGTVTMEFLREAARDEMRKNWRSFSAADFADWKTDSPGADKREAG